MRFRLDSLGVLPCVTDTSMYSEPSLPVRRSVGLNFLERHSGCQAGLLHCFGHDGHARVLNTPNDSNRAHTGSP
jgi:hypothetical protein